MKVFFLNMGLSLVILFVCVQFVLFPERFNVNLLENATNDFCSN